MARKANPTVVGIIPCGTCNDKMEVRERSNGRRLLYTWCPNCKMDQRSGKDIQNFWREQIGISTETTKIVTKPAAERGEWTPDEPQNLPLETKPPQPETKSMFGWAIGGVVACGLLFFGISRVQQ